jgi:hypothetical protein
VKGESIMKLKPNDLTKEQLIEKGFFKPEDFDDVAL